MRRRGTLRPQQGVQYADRLVVMLEDGVGGELAPVWADGSAEVESPGVVVRGLRSAGGRGPWVPRGCCGVVATGGTIGEFIHRAEMDRAEGEAILHGVVPTGVFSVAAAGHRAVIPDVRKRICAAGRIVLEHGVGAERALAAEGQLAEVRGRYTAIVLVIERLARARAVNGERIAGPGRPLLTIWVADALASRPDCGLMPVEALNTTNHPGANSCLPLMPNPVCDRLFGATRNRC